MIPLSDNERRVLAAAQHRARASVSELAGRLRLKDHSVRHALERLSARGVIIGRAPFINSATLGYIDYTFFLSIYARQEHRKELLFAELEQASGVAWVGSLGGEFQLAVSVLSIGVEETLEFFYRLAKRCQITILDKALSVRTRYHAFGRKYLVDKYAVEPFTYGRSGEVQVIDETDRIILSVLAEGRNDSLNDLARSAKIPASTFARRIKELELRGVIQGFIYRLNFNVFGMQQFRLVIFAQGIDLGLTSEIREFARLHPQVTHLFECVGSWDFEIVVEVQHPENINEVSQQLLDRFRERIRNIRIQQVFKHRKYASYPFRFDKTVRRRQE